MNKILIVISLNNVYNGGCLTRYAAKCTDDMLYDVETAFEEMGKSVSVENVEDIAYVLENGSKYIWNGLSFECVDVFKS